MGGKHGGDITPESLMRVVIKGNLCIGDHGQAWRSPELNRQLHSAIFDCGYETLFAVPPTTGDEIWCRRCRDWERCRVVGGSVVECADCDHYAEHGHDRHRAVRQARTHSVGRDGNRRMRHRARVGTHAREGIDWEPYIGE